MNSYLLDTLLPLGLSGAGVVVWWLLRSKDEQQANAIELLFRKHDEDAQRLDDLKLEIARQHYVKPELDAKFDRLELAIRNSMLDLGLKFDKLSDVMIKHYTERNGK